MLAQASFHSISLTDGPKPRGKLLGVGLPLEIVCSISVTDGAFGFRSCLPGFLRQRFAKCSRHRSTAVVSAESTGVRTGGHATAYRLSDGDGGIGTDDIWGGTGGGSPIPSEGVLISSDAASSAVTVTEGPKGTIPDASVRNSDSPKARSRSLTQGFGRLKYQRVKALSSKASSTKREINKRASEERVAIDMDVCATAASDRKSHEDTKQTGGPYISASRDSATRSRGWGNVESVQKIESRVLEHGKKRKMLPFDSDFFSRKTFKELGCCENMIESLKRQLVIRPSNIQAMAFQCVVEGKSCIIADQSGSGKTLSYLVPIIQCLRQEEEQGLGKSLPKKPRVVILVPTAELASQVLNDCRLISKFGVPFRSMVATGGFPQRTQLENLQQGVDILIATPGRFIFLINEGALEVTNLQCAVLDEVDILVKDEDFKLVLQRLMDSSPVNAQYIFVTATLPTEVYNKIIENFPDCQVISGPGVHCTSPHLEEVIVDCGGDGGEKTSGTAFMNKKSALLQLVETSPVPKTIVFCNKIETCRKVENALKRFDRKGESVRVLPFHAALESESRLANLKEFLNPGSENSLFLVCTDRASRGIDFAGVEHVVLFDFPRDPSEYVRRVGRTARGAAAKGKAFIFVIGKQVSLARRILERNQKGHPVHEVPFL